LFKTNFGLTYLLLGENVERQTGSLLPLLAVIFSMIALIFGTKHWVILSNRLGIDQFTAIAQLRRGIWMKYFVELTVSIISFCYVTLHIWFMIQVLDKGVAGSIVVILTCTVLSWVRKLWRLSFNYYLGSIISLSVYLSILLSCPLTFSVPTLTIPLLPLALSSFEALPLILSIKSHSSLPSTFPLVSTFSLLTHCLLTLLLVLTHPQPPLTDLLTSPSASLTLARNLLAFNLLLQVPLTAYTVNFNLEKAVVYRGLGWWRKSRRRQLIKNVTRGVVVMAAWAAGKWGDIT
jgi:hypothetical protein